MTTILDTVVRQEAAYKRRHMAATMYRMSYRRLASIMLYLNRRPGLVVLDDCPFDIRIDSTFYGTIDANPHLQLYEE